MRACEPPTAPPNALSGRGKERSSSGPSEAGLLQAGGARSSPRHTSRGTRLCPFPTLADPKRAAAATTLGAAATNRVGGMGTPKAADDRGFSCPVVRQAGVYREGAGVARSPARRPRCLLLLLSCSWMIEAEYLGGRLPGGVPPAGTGNTETPWPVAGVVGIRGPKGLPINRFGPRGANRSGGGGPASHCPVPGLAFGSGPPPLTLS